MLSITGMSSQLALKLLDATETREMQTIQDSPANARAIQNFKDQAASITSAKDLVSNYDVYSFVMQAYDLKDQMFGKAMIQKILESDSSQTGSLISQMTDPRFTAFYKAMGFTSDGTQNTNFSDPTWQDKIVQQFVQQTYINDEASQNSTVGTALEFRQKAPAVSSWYDILKDKNMGAFMRRVLNLPDGMVNQSLDQQVAAFQQKYDITKLQDPAEVQKLVQKYVITSDALDSAALAANNPAVALISDAVNSPSIGLDGSFTNFAPATFDISSINVSALSASKLYS